MMVETVQVGNVLTRVSGYLRPVCSHSLQPYRGCSLGNSLCGVGCYVQHNPWITQGRRWGSFLEVRLNAAESYRTHYARERAWAQRQGLPFQIFCASSTDPFVPQERKYGITRRLLEAMCECPPDGLILQTHSADVERVAEVLCRLAEQTRLRVQISIETDRERLPGLPPPASRVADRLAACERLKQLGLFTVVTVAPLLPIAEPDFFFERIAAAAEAVVLDHFIGGDGTANGSRTQKTPLVAVLAEISPESLQLDYRDRMAEIARRHLPGRVGIGQAGFAGLYE